MAAECVKGLFVTSPFRHVSPMTDETSLFRLIGVRDAMESKLGTSRRGSFHISGSAESVPKESINSKDEIWFRV